MASGAFTDGPSPFESTGPAGMPPSRYLGISFLDRSTTEPSHAASSPRGFALPRAAAKDREYAGLRSSVREHPDGDGYALGGSEFFPPTPVHATHASRQVSFLPAKEYAPCDASTDRGAAAGGGSDTTEGVFMTAGAGASGAGLDEDSDSDACGSDTSSLSARSEAEFLEKHVQSLLNPHATRDLVLKTVGACLFFGLLVLVVYGLHDLRETNDRLREAGVRITAEFPCPGSIERGRVVSHDGAGYHEGLGVVLGETFTVGMAHGAYGAVVGALPLPPFEEQRTLIVITHPRDALVAFAVVAKNATETAPAHATVGLGHAEVLAVEVHAEVPERAGEWNVLLVYTRRGENATYFATVTVTAGGAAQLGPPRVFATASKSAEATWLRGLPMRYAVATADQGPEAPTRFHLLEVGAGGVLALQVSDVSSQLLGAATLDMMPVPSLAGGAFVVLAREAVVLVQAVGGGFVEWDAVQVHCGATGHLGEGGASDGPMFHEHMLAACAGGAAGPWYALYMSSDRELVARPLDIAADPRGSGLRPVRAVGTDSGDVLVAVERTAPQEPHTAAVCAETAAEEAQCAAPAVGYEMYRVTFRDGVAHVSDAVELAAGAGGLLALTPTGLFQLDAARRKVAYRSVTWRGGLKIAGVTAAACAAGEQATLLLQGLLDGPAFARPGAEAAPPETVVGFPVYPHVEGGMTQHRHAASMREPLGRAVSGALLYIDVLHRQ
eukprot:TRINITY_DN5869_c1_g1_i1.p1 TRINITY_DN5869_c1_g1~~TRINITY_DN5869_c1_g1_i1.p1  ORF type:complete len:725 (+),score=171.36 TRINITY_DN5869_c1_g1_i1:78-2252(+)